MLTQNSIGVSLFIVVENGCVKVTASKAGVAWVSSKINRRQVITLSKALSCRLFVDQAKMQMLVVRKEGDRIMGPGR